MTKKYIIVQTVLADSSFNTSSGGSGGFSLDLGLNSSSTYIPQNLRG